MIQEKPTLIDVYECISPLDFRYREPAAKPQLSEIGFTAYKTRYELTLLRAFVKRLAQRGLASEASLEGIEQKVGAVTTAHVYHEEYRKGGTNHDIQALVNTIKRKLHTVPELCRLLHIPATSWDDISTANAARWKDAYEQHLAPALMNIEKELIRLAVSEAATVQVGRTHRQHAVPITFGMYVAEYVHRLGGCIEKLRQLASELEGKCSGATGSFNGASLFFGDVKEFEAEVVEAFGLKAALHSKQTTHPEPTMRFFEEIVRTSGVLANFSRDVCNLLRPEIRELSIIRGKGEVGSSTMKQKINPIVYENGEGVWKILVGRLVTVLMDQVNEHQRTLDNSVTSRQYSEMIAYLIYVAKRMARAIPKLQVNREKMLENILQYDFDLLLAEKLYILLAVFGKRDDAPEKAGALCDRARQEGKTLKEVCEQDTEIRRFLEDSLPAQLQEDFFNPMKYTGKSELLAVRTAALWAKRFGILTSEL